MRLSKPEVSPINLREVRRALSVFYDMPHGKCDIFAYVVSQIFGLDIRVGEFIDLDRTVRHAWNYDSNNHKIIDITADQFKRFNKESLFSMRAYIFPKDYPYYIESKNACHSFEKCLRNNKEFYIKGYKLISSTIILL